MASEAPTKTKITLYWLNKSRAQRIVWLLEECTNIEYEIKVYKRTKDELAPDELKKIHPLGKSPLIGVQPPGRTEPIIVAESAFITEYLAEHFAPQLIPAKYPQGRSGPGEETETWMRYRFYMHYAEGSLMALLVTYHIVNMLRGDQVPFLIKPVTRAIVGKMEQLFFGPNLKTHFSFLEQQLASSPDGGPYLCGKELTAADILMSFPLIAAIKSKISPINGSDYPKVSAYVDRLESFQGYKTSIKKVEELTGEKYDLL